MTASKHRRADLLRDRRLRQHGALHPVAVDSRAVSSDLHDHPDRRPRQVDHNARCPSLSSPLSMTCSRGPRWADPYIDGVHVAIPGFDVDGVVVRLDKADSFVLFEAIPELRARFAD